MKVPYLFFPNDKYFPDYYLKQTTTANLIDKNCNINIKIPGYNDLNVDVKHCCNNLVKDLWCNPVYRSDPLLLTRTMSAKDIYNNFYNCVEQAIIEAIMIRANRLSIINRFKFLRIAFAAMTSYLLTLNESLGFDYINFIKLPKNILDILSDNLNENSNSCICDPVNGKPTFCCYPELNPEFCECFGKVRNLCEDCDSYIIKFRISDYFFNDKDANMWICLPDDDKGRLFTDKNNPAYITYELYDVDNNNQLINKSKTEVLNDLEHVDPIYRYEDDKNLESTHLLTVKIPKGKTIRMVVTIVMPCGKCCVDNNGKRLSGSRRTIRRERTFDATLLEHEPYRDLIAKFAFEPSEIKVVEDMGCKPSPTCPTANKSNDRPD